MSRKCAKANGGEREESSGQFTQVGFSAPFPSSLQPPSSSLPLPPFPLQHAVPHFGTYYRFSEQGIRKMNENNFCISLLSFI